MTLVLSIMGLGYNVLGTDKRVMSKIIILNCCVLQIMLSQKMPH